MHRLRINAYAKNMSTSGGVYSPRDACIGANLARYNRDPNTKLNPPPFSTYDSKSIINLLSPCRVMGACNANHKKATVMSGAVRELVRIKHGRVKPNRVNSEMSTLLRGL